MQCYGQNMNILISVDDIGASRGITDNILSSIDIDSSNLSLSYITNQDSFEYACNKTFKFPNFYRSVHVNLIEGRPLSSRQDFIFADSNHNFNFSFFKLFFKYYFSSEKSKKIIENQLMEEIDLQIKKLIQNSPENSKFRLDSHQHLHMLPFLFGIFIVLAKRNNINNIRLVKEEFQFLPTKLYFWKSFFSINLVKYLVLRCCSYFCEKQILRSNFIQTNESFFGVFYTGKMSIEKLVNHAMRSKYKNLEVLFHPGAAEKQELELWHNYPELKNYYYSQDRHAEARELGRLTNIISQRKDWLYFLSWNLFNNWNLRNQKMADYWVQDSYQWLMQQKECSVVDSILDYGCGFFDLGIKLLRNVNIVDAYEPHQVSVEIARARLPQNSNTLLTSKLEDLDNRKYNVIVLNSVMQYFSGKEELKKLLHFAKAKFKSEDSFLLIADVIPENYSALADAFSYLVVAAKNGFFMSMLMHLIRSAINPNGHKLYHVSPDEFKTIAYTNGFEIQFLPKNLTPSKIRYTVLLKLRK